MMKKIDKSYVSPLDEFMAEYDKQHPKKSVSQEKEIKKAARVARLRDMVDGVDVTHRELWEDD